MGGKILSQELSGNYTQVLTPGCWVMTERVKCVAGSAARPHVVAVTVLLTLAILPFALAGSPRLSSTIIVAMVLGYAVSSIVYPVARWAFLVAALVAHAASIAIYYTNPLILPFVILEREGGRYSINIDVIQLILIYEVRNIVLSTWSCREPEEAGEP